MNEKSAVQSICKFCNEKCYLVIFLFQSFSGGSGDDDAGGDEDQESSSFENIDALKSFREQWKRELRISPKHTPHNLIKKAQVSDNTVSDFKVKGDRLKNSKPEELSIETKVRTLSF